MSDVIDRSQIPPINQTLSHNDLVFLFLYAQLVTCWCVLSLHNFINF